MAVTDAGGITHDALADNGIGDVVITKHTTGESSCDSPDGRQAWKRRLGHDSHMSNSLKYDYDNHSTKVPLDGRGRRSGLAIVSHALARSGKPGPRTPAGR